jgi:hypothetical protein
MGGHAVQALLPTLAGQEDNSARKLYVGKINDSDLEMLMPKRYGVFPLNGDQSYIGHLLSFLGKKGLIDKNYAPTFMFGSTRLAALKQYGRDAIWTDPLETDDIIQIANAKKVEFGDLDLDVTLLSDKKNIVAAINQIDPSTFAARLVGDIHVAIRLGDKVVQVDLVDVPKEKQGQNFHKKNWSSFVDLAAGVKGAMGTRLLRAVTANMDISPHEALDALFEFANKNPEASFSIALQRKIQNGYKPVRARFSLGGEGVKLAVDLKKIKDDKELLDKVDFDINPRAGYNDLDNLAKTVLQQQEAKSTDIFHAVNLAAFVKKYKKNKINSIWNYFIEICEKTLKGHIDDTDYKTGIEELGKILGTTNMGLINEARESVGRFLGKNQFSNIEMIELLDAIVTETNSKGKEQIKINLKEDPVIDMVEKMDSSFCQFGIDRSGKFFMESSNSGPVYETTINQKWGLIDLTEPFNYLNKNQKFQSSLKKIFKTIGPFKYDAEMFPVLTHKGNEKNEIVFIATKYRKEKFGNFGAFVVFKTWLWNDHSLSWFRPEPQRNVHLTELIKHEAKSGGWDKDWKIYTNDSDMKLPGILTINLGRVLTEFLASPHMVERAKYILQQRGRTKEKEYLVNEIDIIRSNLQDALDAFANNTHSVLGDSQSHIEGVVLRVKTRSGDIFEVKGTSAEFELQKEYLWHDRIEIMNLETKLENQIIKDVLKLKTNQPAALNKIISQAAEEFITQQSGQNKKTEFIRFLVPQMIEGENDFDLTKSNAFNVLNQIEREQDILLQSFKQNEPNLDVDTIRKTTDVYEAFKNKFQSFKRMMHSPLNGTEFYVQLFNAVLGFRIEKFMNFSEELSTVEEEKREKVIIWTGRAQPWHKGHDAMIRKGKMMLENLGATKILIMIVKGGLSSTNLDENPLNEKEQIELIYSLYRNDPQVEIYKRFPKSSFITDIVEHLSSTGYTVAGWLAGSDRFSDYRKAIRGFNPAKFKQTHEYSPILFDHSGTPKVQMIETPRIMSGTKAREMAKELDFRTWLQEVAPESADKTAMRVYLTIYNKLRQGTI